MILSRNYSNNDCIDRGLLHMLLYAIFVNSIHLSYSMESTDKQYIVSRMKAFMESSHRYYLGMIVTLIVSLGGYCILFFC